MNKRMFDLTDKVILLTGGAGLLGQRYTKALLAHGATVVVSDIDAVKAQAIADSNIEGVTGKAIGRPLDVTDKHSISALLLDIVEEFGRLDGLINNAAIDPKFDKGTAGSRAMTFEEYPIELWQQSIDVNLTGVFLCCQVIGGYMAECQQGVIVNIGSTYGMVAPNQSLYRRADELEQTRYKPPDYPVTKGGIMQLTRYLAAYWREKNVRVNTLSPGGVYNDQEEDFVQRYSEMTPLGRMASKDEMNGAIVFLCSEASSYMTGANLVIDGGWTAW